MLNEAFLSRMKNMLGGDFAEFEAALSEDAVRGVRANPIKCECDLFELGTLPLSPLSYHEGGYALTEDVQIGKTPEHHSGMIYVQDPGAMSTVTAVDIPRGAFVLDTCSAPGGKASQLAAAIGEDGFIIANEYVPKRAKIIVSNFERLGIRNAMVTSMDTAELSKYFDGAFDLVLCDAPCSGEGMFRKSQNALDDWSEANVRSSAERQREILNNIAALVRPGGYLLYSTCTYLLEENEMTVDAFLASHGDFTIEAVKPALASVTADGIVFEGAKCGELSLCRRFYPHVSSGEGQFIALLKRSEKAPKMQSILYKDAAKEISRDEERIISSFFAESLVDRPRGRIVKHGEAIVLIEHGCPLLPKSVFMYGTLLGEITKGIFKPSHHFFSAYGRLFKNKVELSESPERLSAYLRGEEIAAQGDIRGFCAVTYHGAAIGGGKASGGVIKNHYPKGLRNP